ncbi:MAG: DNA pilot protein [Microviridae sp.]|nr:MAG: DNA pilot protein [Microviridae sp.]
MPIPLIVPIATGLASMIGSIVSQRNAAKVARQNTNLTIQANKEQAQKSYDLEQKNIMELNKYNSPQSQMDRFVQAGLNKNLIYQQGNPGNQSQIAHYNAPNIQYAYQPKFDPGKAINSGINAFQTATQIQNLITQGKISKAELTLKSAVAKYADDLAYGKAQATLNSMEITRFKRIFSEEEFDRFFYYDRKTNKATLRPSMAETFFMNLTGKWLKPWIDTTKTQADIERIKSNTSLNVQALQNLKVIPWLNPFIGFLKLLK